MARNPFDNFTDKARQVFVVAQDEARRLNHNYLGTEHLLLAMLRVKQSVAGEVLGELGLKYTRVRRLVQEIVGHGQSKPDATLAVTPRVKRVMELASKEARKRHHDYIGTEHLLLGLIQEGEGVAVRILESLGLSRERVRSTVMQKMATPKDYLGRNLRELAKRTGVVCGTAVVIVLFLRRLTPRLST